MVGREVCQAWWSWAAGHALRSSRQGAVRSVGLHLLHRRLTAGLVAWRAMASMRRERLELAGWAVTFMCHRQVARGWNAWAGEVRRRHRVCAVAFVMERVALHMTQHSLAHGLDGWRSARLQAARRKATLSHAAMCMLHRGLAVGWRQWRSWLAERQAIHHGALHMVHRRQ